MPNASLDAVLKEAYATAPSDVVYLDTLEISHPAVGSSIFLVKDRVDHTLTLETTEEVLFKGCSFKVILPSSGQNGVQEISVAIDNVDRAIGDFIETAKESLVPVSLSFRPYLASDPTTPLMNPPLTLFLRDVVVNAFQVTGKATFADILNKRFLSLLYTRERFPSLAN